jgi:predicted dehydrogenase
MANPLTAILIGAGSRGAQAYAPYALKHPDELRFMAVAEPNEARRTRFAQAHAIPGERQFQTWEEVLALGQIADVALIATMDRLHIEPALSAIQAGYHVLLEKPMATTLADCVGLVHAAERHDRILQICHVLRYTAFFSTLHEILRSGRLGELITVEHRENVVYWHMAHSYVRGHWRNSRQESPMILAKCCHDLDILYWNLGAVRRLSSIGSLIHFRPENAPPGAPPRCTDGCPAAQECPWYAPRLYLDLVPLYHTARNSSIWSERLGATLLLDHPGLASVLRRVLPAFERAADYRDWPVSVISVDGSYEARRRALENGPWGRCVYACDNDVVDHQIVSMEMESGASAALVMHGHAHQESRSMRYDGTRASLRGLFQYGHGDEIEIHDHRSGKVERIRPQAGGSGHGGGDEGLMAAFVRTVRGEAEPLTSARAALESHLMAFAAEQARLEGGYIEMASYRRLHDGSQPDGRIE